MYLFHMESKSHGFFFQRPQAYHSNAFIFWYSINGKDTQKTESSLLFTGERDLQGRTTWPLLSPFSSFSLAWLTQNYSLIFSGTKDAEFILQASTKQNTLTSRTLKKTFPPLLSFLLLWSLEGLSDCKVKGEREGQSDLFSLIFP